MKQDRQSQPGPNILLGDLSGEIDQIIIDVDINLLTAIERINRDECLKEITLKLLRGETIIYSCTHDIIYHLELAGAISRKGRFCQIQNTIYKRFLKQYFDI